MRAEMWTFSAQSVALIVNAFAKLGVRILTYAHVCSRMLTHAHVCSRMLTQSKALIVNGCAKLAIRNAPLFFYADVCSRMRSMLTYAYADVCARQASATRLSSNGLAV
jgi:hypothetical protein